MQRGGEQERCADDPGRDQEFPVGAEVGAGFGAGFGAG
jgi:hypothetical protein